MKINLSPQEKAKQLSEKYYQYTPYWDCRYDVPDENDYHIRCALEEVKGIIEFGNSLGLREELIYWNSVKKELNKMLKEYERIN